MKLEYFLNSNRYRIENTYVAYSTLSKKIDKWTDSGLVICYGSAESVKELGEYPHIIGITAKELYSVDVKLFTDYINSIDAYIESGEIEVESTNEIVIDALNSMAETYGLLSSKQDIDGFNEYLESLGFEVEN